MAPPRVFPVRMSSLLLLSTAALLPSLSLSATIVVGGDQRGWQEGVCYKPLDDVRVGDVLEFNFGAHDVFRMPDEQSFFGCRFDESAVELAPVGQGLLMYTVTEEDATDGTLYFACSVGAHCASGHQKLRVSVSANDDDSGVPPRSEPPRSEVLFGESSENCELIQSGVEFDGEFLRSNSLRSECTEPAWSDDDDRYHVSCLSGPATLTPGGVINSARMLHYPYPTDRRVVVGQRTWEFVSGDPTPPGGAGSGGGFGGVTPVPINQMYVHHLSGRVILGQGTEGIRRSTPDAPFVKPYGSLTGDEGDLMVFHIIDLREVDQWLECVECRCKDADGTYLDTGYGDGETGGVSCCTNCTDLAGPTVDYRMRYNVSYSDVPEDEPVTVLSMLTADISPAVGKNLEFDVPSFMFLDPSEQAEADSHVQRLERVAPFRELFKHDFFGADYHGPDTVKLFRCVGHLHIAALGMWLEDVITGETLCAGVGTHGTDPEADKGFLNAISVDNYDTPKIIAADAPVRLVTEYNATTLHTGVMGMLFIFISSERQITREEASLTADVCSAPICDASLLPAPPSAAEAAAPCEDALASNPACTFGGLCDCETFVNSPESTGCGGTYASDFGDMPVNSMCAKHCGACGDGDGGASSSPASSCEDVLVDSPACKFANLCDCAALATAPESTGCGGVYPTQMGDLVLNDLCPNYCDACPDESSDEVIQEKIVEMLEDDLSELCEYSTAECSRFLSNLYSCAGGADRTQELDANVEAVLAKRGRDMAMEHAMLGDASLHVEADERQLDILPCGSEGEGADDSYDPDVKVPDTPDEDKELGDDDVTAGARSEAGGDSGANTGAIVGGILGGVALVAIVGGLWHANGKKKKKEVEAMAVDKLRSTQVGGTQRADNFDSDHNV